MHDIIFHLGQRIKRYRIQKGLSQEHLAELADCHPTYIGQIERGEKNATIESIFKLSSALHISLSELFYELETEVQPPHIDSGTNAIPLKCYNLILAKEPQEQTLLYNILVEIERYKKP